MGKIYDLIKLQAELKAPKGQYNSFGKYAYRSCEDIVEAVKPLCEKYGLLLNLSDEIVVMGDRYYVKATASVTDEEGSRVESFGLAREPDDKKGMDASQVTGTASSYARKYALNGLFAIDDSKDADTDAYAMQTGHKSSDNRSQARPANKAPATTQAAVPMKLVCSACGADVVDYKKGDGSVIPAAKVYDSCGGMCPSCYQKSKGDK